MSEPIAASVVQFCVKWLPFVAAIRIMQSSIPLHCVSGLRSLAVDMINVSLFCLLASYVVALGLEVTFLFRRRDFWRWLSLGMATAGWVAHTIYLFNRNDDTNLPPLVSSSHDWLLVLAWLGVTTYLLLSVIYRKMVFGVFAMPIALLLVVMSAYVGYSPNRLLEAQRVWKMLHAASLALGFMGILMGLVLSVMFLIQHRRLKSRKSFGEQSILPSLEKLAWLNRWSVILSVPMLTLGMGSGVALAVYSWSSPEPVTFFDPVILGYVAVWIGMIVLFAWLLTSRRTAGKQVASLTFWSCGFVLFTVLGLQMLTTSWHG